MAKNTLSIGGLNVGANNNAVTTNTKAGSSDNSLGGIARSVLGFDITPGFNLTNPLAKSHNSAQPAAKSTPASPPPYNPAVLGTGIAAAAGAGGGVGGGPSAGALRTAITDLVNTVKGIYNQRYGQIDQAAQEQSGALNDRFGNESSDLASQVDSTNGQVGANAAAGGTFDSSYRANNQDAVTHQGQSQVRDLGTELQDNLAKVGGVATSQKAEVDANKGGLDLVVKHLAESTNPTELQNIRNTVEARLAQVQADSAGGNTNAQNRAALEAIAPSTPRAVQLKTTLGQIVAGSASPQTKAAVGQQLIGAAGLSQADQQKLLQAFNSDLSAATQQQPAA